MTPDEMRDIVGRHKLDIDYANLPTQDAVEFVSVLVTLQATKAKFARGVPTVGGRIHVGVITRQRGFQMINEPDLTHLHTGFTHDL